MSFRFLSRYETPPAKPSSFPAHPTGTGPAITRAEAKAHDAAVATATAYTASERAAISDARKQRDETRQASETAKWQWWTAAQGKYERGGRTDAAATRVDDLFAESEQSMAAHEVACRNLAIVENSVEFDRVIRIRRVDDEWQALVDHRALERARPMIGVMTRIHVFDSVEEREAVYQARAAG